MSEAATPNKRRRPGPSSVLPSTPPPAATPGRTRRIRVSPVFLVTTARSGSTLLRYLLDSHPDIVCPPELNLSTLLQHAAQTWHNVNACLGESDDTADRDGAPTNGTAAVYSPEAYAWAGKIVEEIFNRCAQATGASVFVDKSLTTVEQLATVSRCYPKATYIFLYRFPLDMIASGIEASRWGFNAFGFTPYVGAAPGNFVAGLANYWIDKVTKMLEFEESCTTGHARIYYELLCDEPAATLTGLLDLLGLPADDSLVARAFESEHGRGPGDYKIDFTRTIDPGSIGRGSTLPDMLGPDQITRMDALLARLDYPSLASVRRDDLSALLGLKSTREHSDDNDEMGRLLLRSLSEVSPRGRRGTGPAPVSFEVLLRGGPGPSTLVIVDETGAVTLGDASQAGAPLVRPRVSCAGDVLRQVASGDINLAQAVHDGRIRVEIDAKPSRSRQNQIRAVLAAVSTALHQASDAGGDAHGS